MVPDPAGGEAKQIRKSTGKRNEREAKAVATEMEQAALRAVGLTDERCRRIHAILIRAGEDALRRTLNAVKARSYIADLVKISTGEDVPSFSVRTWTEEWQARKLPSVAVATKRRYAGSLKAFLNWLGEKADRPLESVTVADVRKFRDALEAEGRSIQTCQFYVADVGSVFRAAVREGLIPHNPATALERKQETSKVKRKAFTIDEVRSLLSACDSNAWKGVILLGAFAGLRLGDAAKLNWSAIDLSQGTINTVPAKTRRKGKILTVPMHPEVRKYLASRDRKSEESGPVFGELSTIPVEGRNGLSRRFKVAMESAGVSSSASSGDLSPGTARRHRIPERSFHSLRHTFTSWLANADVSPELRMKLTGHTTADVHAGYTHHELATLADAVTKLPKLSSRE